MYEINRTHPPFQLERVRQEVPLARTDVPFSRSTPLERIWCTQADLDDGHPNLLRFQALLDNISHPDFDYVALQEGPNYFLRVVCPEGTCQATGEPHAWAGRKWRLSRHMTDGEVVQTALMATLAAVEHEAREAFAFKGAAIFSPHFDIDKLVELAANDGGIKERPHGPS